MKQKIKKMKKRTILFILLATTILFPQANFAQKSTKSYVFGHSLYKHDHNSSDIATTNIPFWFNDLANAAGHSYAIDGQFGQPDYHAIPPEPGWGWDHIASAWDTDFATSAYDNVIVTEANFIQWVPPTSTQTGFNRSSVDNFLRIYDHVNGQTPGIKFYVYENWPEFGANEYPYPPNPQQMLNYHNYTKGAFHDWWIELHDALVSQRPDSQIKLIPAGPIISGLLTDIPELSTVTHEDLYSDDAPHGHPVLYFLSALVHYMVIYEEMAPANYTFPANKVPQEVQDNYTAIVDYIWGELATYNFEDESSRVFYNGINIDPSTSSANFTKEVNSIDINAFPNPFSDYLMIDLGGFDGTKVDVLNIQGKLVYSEEIDPTTNNLRLDFPQGLKKGTYFLRFSDKNKSNTIKIVNW